MALFGLGWLTLRRWRILPLHSAIPGHTEAQDVSQAYYRMQGTLDPKMSQYWNLAELISDSLTIVAV